MKISNDQLNDFVVGVAGDAFGNAIFRRRSLMLAVETKLKESGWWTPSDDQPSASVGSKSAGLAKIDWAISHLKESGRLLNPSRNKWKLPRMR